MKKCVDKIEKIIDKEIEEYKLLEKSLDTKTEFLMKNDVKNLEELDIKIIEQLNNVAVLNNKRQKECITLGRIDLSFDEIIKRTLAIDESQATRLLEKKSTFQSIYSNIQKKNNINAKLIQNSLLVLNKRVDFVLKMVAPELDSYNQKGNMKKINENYKISSIEKEA